MCNELLIAEFESSKHSQEIERRWTAVVPEEIPLGKAASITQWYLLSGEENGVAAEFRIRKLDDSFLITLKRGSGLTRSETECLIKSNDIDCAGLNIFPSISKSRYKIPHESGNIVELNIFHGVAEGVITAEVEFLSERAATAFDAPYYFTLDVTNDPTYESRALAQKT